MRKTILTLLSGFACFYAQSQISLALDFGFGLTNNSQELTSSEFVEDYTSRALPSFYAGFNLDIPIGNQLSLNPGVIFTQRGNIATPLNEEFKTVVDFVALPLWLKWRWKDNLTLKAGLEYAYLLNHRTKSKLYGNEEKFVIDKRQHDLGIQLGSELNLNKRLYLDFRFVLGIIEQYRPAYVPVYIVSEDIYLPLNQKNHSAYSRSIYLGLGYRLFNRN